MKKLLLLPLITTTLSLLISVLAPAFEKPPAQDQGTASVIESLQKWRVETSERSDLEDRERDLRQQFISRLLFQIERKYMGENLKLFFQSSIWDMCLTDRMKMNQSLGGMEVFLENLNFSLKELLEPSENPLHFVEAFTEFSGISDPASMEEFADTRNYYDGRQVQGANPLELDQAANYAEEKESLGDFQARLADLQYNLKKDFDASPRVELEMPEQLDQATPETSPDVSPQLHQNIDLVK